MLSVCGFEGISNIFKIVIVARWLSWLERRPVTAEVVGSNPIRVAVIISQMITCWKQLTIIYGVLAQLGEHLPYKQRVTGSSPVGPINFADLAQWQSS